ncbi:NAD(P)/FAD-dependent oxidoreductase [Nocardioides ferulae]|uniref:NAD(P)/FAD-dependent oxidoreductase n=1 Tax=Nocardioides ferulae TaxID=2340821 RepID=UPI001980F3DA|nr:NAD(P)/FAD-dependent oxidoreductase [Nocardioides ferulae]
MSATPTTPSSTEPSSVLTPDVVIVGAGPAGLRAASELAGQLPGQVLVLEREREAGGIPRHSDHPGYGMRDLGRFVTGPKYARLLREKAQDAGATILTEAMATDWAGPRSLMVTSPQGRLRVDARSVVLATGARERPRAARSIPGDRAHGIYTTGTLQNVVHLKHGTVGKRAVVVGAELVSWSAVLTLKHAGCETALMTTSYPQSESYWLFHRPGRMVFGTQVATRTRVTRIIGRPRVQAVEIEHLDTGRRRLVECDTVVLTGDWIPDNELARAAGLPLDPGSLGPLVDTALRTDRPGVFAIGNALHPVDTADIAALDGAAVAEHVRGYLDGRRPAPDSVRLQAEAPFRWVAPGILRAGDPAPPRKRLLLWTDEHVAAPRVVLVQDGRVVARKRVPWPAAPGRVFRVPSDVLDHVDPRGGTVTVGLDR